MRYIALVTLCVLTGCINTSPMQFSEAPGQWAGRQSVAQSFAQCKAEGHRDIDNTYGVGNLMSKALDARKNVGYCMAGKGWVVQN